METAGQGEGEPLLGEDSRDQEGDCGRADRLGPGEHELFVDILVTSCDISPQEVAVDEHENQMQMQVAVTVFLLSFSSLRLSAINKQEAKPLHCFSELAIG